MKKGRSLLYELKWTVVVLTFVMLIVWGIFYVNLHRLVKNYVLENMEQVSVQVISELNRSFLQLEEVSFALSEDPMVHEFLLTEDSSSFYAKAPMVEDILSHLSEETTFMDNVILFNQNGKFYRFSGNISNVGIQKIMNSMDQNAHTYHLKLHLDQVDYIGFVSEITYQGNVIGKIMMLTDENEILRLFQEMTQNQAMKIALAADEEVVAANDEDLVGKNMQEMIQDKGYMIHKRVGFTPFSLIVSYRDTNHQMSILFFLAMFMIAVIMFLIFGIFYRFWKNKFFYPIQTVISEVEAFDSKQGEKLPLTGLAHFDGLVGGINDMIDRIEHKEKEAYEARLKGQKSLIISLKKQISAHFTVNVLNIIKALSEEGENDKAGVLCDGLSYLLRYANDGDSYISIMEEFFILQKYADIMQIRYPGRFTIDIEMEDYLDELEIPRMLLQPILENSLIHGFHKRNGLVRVYSILHSDTIQIIVEDQGCGMDSMQLQNLCNSIAVSEDYEVEVGGLSHVALENIQRRIHSYFGDAFGIQIESKKDQGTKVTVTLPLCHRGI